MTPFDRHGARFDGSAGWGTSLGDEHASWEVARMIILGVICLILGVILEIGILWTIGLILIVVGIILWILGMLDRAVAGRRYWY